jgi:type IV secretory pathway VirB6-like protein
MRRFFFLLLLLSLASAAAFGQVSPADQDTVDVFASFDRDIHTALNGLSPILVSYVLGPLNKVAVALLVCVLASEGFRAVTHHQILNIDYLVKAFFLPYGFALVVLNGWNTPIPGLGHSFVGLFTDTSQEIAAYVDLSAMKMMFQKFGEIYKALGVSPSVLDDGFVTYWLVVGSMILVKTIVFLVTSFGFVALAVGSCIGPLFVFFYLFPPTRYLWHSWVGAMVKYSFYFIIAAVVTDIWCVFVVDQINTSLNDNYDLDHFMALTLSLPAIMLAFCFGLFKVPALASDFTSGSSHAGHGLVGGVASFLRGALS